MSRHLPRRRLPRDWSGVVLAGLFATSFVSGVIGFGSHYCEVTWTSFLNADVIYRSIQLFFLEFKMPPDAGCTRADPGPFLQVARFGAFFTTIWAIISAFFPAVSRNIRRLLRVRGTSCAVILGYGPVGQAMGAALWQRDCGIRRVTAVHPAVTPELSARARADGVLLIEGDPSDPLILKRVYVQKAERIYISDPDDLRAIDTAVAVRQHFPNPEMDIRVVLNDSTLGSQIAEAASAGFLGAPNVRWFSVADETARLLIADARFDRFALESGSSRMHLVIVGCGSQGEAVAVEALLTSWRTGLGPPKITFLDRDVASIEARMRRRMPAWFGHPEAAALYPAVRPDLEFLDCDAETVDFARDACFDGLRERVSGWVFATGDDALNLRASIVLHRAIMARQIDPAPVYIRILTGHLEDAPDLSANPLGLADIFGSTDNAIARSPILAEDPDAVPRTLHAAYRTAEQEMFGRVSEDWASLPETKREANRALFRHAVMKIEDFGAVAAMRHDGVPVTHPSIAGTLRRVDESLAYDRIDRGLDVAAWLKEGATLGEGDAATAILIRDAAICEHNRWTMERALSQFVPTTRPDRALRDDARRRHNNMHDWFDLGDSEIRRYDVVMLRALLSQRIEPKQVPHKKVRARELFLAIDGGEGRCSAHVLESGDAPAGDVSELHVHVNARAEPRKPEDLLSSVMTCLSPHIDQRRRQPPARIRFDFPSQPGERVLTLANLVADELRRNSPTRHGSMRSGTGGRLEARWLGSSGTVT